MEEVKDESDTSCANSNAKPTREQTDNKALANVSSEGGESMVSFAEKVMQDVQSDGGTKMKKVPSSYMKFVSGLSM